MSIWAQSQALGSARPGLDIEVGVVGIARLVEEGDQLVGVDVGDERLVAGHRFRHEVGVLPGELDGGLEVIVAILELEEGIELSLQAIGLLDGLLGQLLVVPEFGGLHLLVEGGDLLLQFRDVKDTSGVPTGGP